MDNKAKREQKTIETCNGAAESDEGTDTCALCVALNHTVFWNKKKPKYYHIGCKCWHESTAQPNVSLDFPLEKITDYLLSESHNKLALMRSMGYDKQDADELYSIIAENAKDKYLKGEYDLGELTKNGQQLNIVLLLKGKGAKAAKTYPLVTGWMVYPYGKLHNNSPFSGWAKEKNV
jgi:hypothetical protein